MNELQLLLKNACYTMLTILLSMGAWQTITANNSLGKTSQSNELPNIIFFAEPNKPVELFVRTIDGQVDVDWGDGSIQQYNSEYPIVGQATDTVRIYGQAIDSIDCSNAGISSLDISNSEDLEYLLCYNNHLLFSSMPKVDSDITAFEYAPQERVQLLRSFNANLPLDLSSEWIIQNKAGSYSNTQYLWKTKSGNTLVLNVDYTFDKGITRFIEEQADSVYCEMTNGFFPDLVLRTRNVKILPAKPDLTLFGPLFEEFTFWLNPVGGPGEHYVQIDWGDGVRVNTQINSSIVTGIASDTVKIYGKTLRFTAYADSKITYLNTNDNQFIDQITVVNSNIKEFHAKNCPNLRYIDFNDNKTESIDITGSKSIIQLNSVQNKLKAIDLSTNINLEILGLNYNQLEYIDISNNTKLKMAYLYDNNLQEINIDNNQALTSLSVFNNYFRISALPAPRYGMNYSFSPQKLIKMPKKDYLTEESIDLSKELFSIDRDGVIQTTAFKWYAQPYSAYPYLLQKDLDYAEDNGVFTFLSAQTDSVYCQMTNAAFGNQIFQSRKLFISDDTPTGLLDSELAKKDKRLFYPNPVNSTINLNMDYQNLEEIKIYDLNGELVFARSTFNNSVMDLSSLKQGVYLLCISYEGKVYSDKLIKY